MVRRRDPPCQTPAAVERLTPPSRLAHHLLSGLVDDAKPTEDLSEDRRDAAASGRYRPAETGVVLGVGLAELADDLPRGVPPVGHALTSLVKLPTILESRTD